MSIAEKQITIAQNVPKVFTAGYEKGKAEVSPAKEEQEKTVTITENGTKEVLPDEDKTLSKVTVEVKTLEPEKYARIMNFHDVEFPNDYELVLNLERCVNFAFTRSTGLKKVKIKGNVSNELVDMTDTFLRCTSLEEIDFLEYNLNVSKLHQTFNSCTSLKRILGNFDLTNCTKYHNAFSTSIEEIRFVAESIKYTFDMYWCSKLSVESAKSILLGLANYAETENEFSHMVKIYITIWDSLDAEGETAPSDTTWRDYVYLKGWLT